MLQPVDLGHVADGAVRAHAPPLGQQLTSTQLHGEDLTVAVEHPVTVPLLAARSLRGAPVCLEIVAVLGRDQ